MPRRKKHEPLSLEEQLDKARAAQSALEEFRAKVEKGVPSETQQEPLQIAPEPSPPPTLTDSFRAAAAMGFKLEGMQDEEIAELTGMDVVLVRRAIADHCRSSMASPLVEPDIVRALEMERLSILIKGLWQSARTGDCAAVDRVERLLKRYSELAGVRTLEGPSRVGPSVDYSRLTKEELLQLRTLEAKLLPPTGGQKS